ncbi:acylphosphatase [Isoptericola sp. CG 20/1183]|uniref:acylphosphatase n=1 Tax=Isoptericola halotolerans TaxID=300560 RepID=A0ABX5EDJ4_9MICO|nr:MULTISPECIES: acylphosphatase [Isoptericola]MCK0115698.1 acylphosphatase [Isoptericola sp. S6320L]PRZ02643.1 acylphosphatase [Isoptericola sp. CG 20/1183]PRZ02995.1 acylphosphatase [Isoptericola halotolerans]
MSIRVHVLVRGAVQGVGFRAAAEHAARDAGVAGFVRNRTDGTLEAALEGERADVDRVLELLRTGPDGAHVTGVEVEQVPLRDERSFAVR